jgi:serine/threonine-protein kinase
VKVRKRFIPGDQLAREPRLAAGSEPGEESAAAEPERTSEAASTTGSSSEKGALSINSRPWSQVTIDGKLIGNTPQMSIPLVAGRHKVKLANPELGIVRGFNVDIEPGQTTTKTIEFGE